MLYIFKNRKWFTLLFFTILIIDILVKLNLSSFPYRYFSKPFVVFSLIVYYYLNNKEKDKKQKKWVFLSLIVFLIGDLIIINHDNFIFLAISMVCFSLAKVFLSLRFSHKHDFNIMRLIPLSILMFAYTIFIVSMVYQNLGDFFAPAITCFFLSLLLFQFAILRRGIVDRVSYLYVLIGVIFFILSESMMAIKTFNTALPYQDVLIMLFYGSALYLIVMGIVSEKKLMKEEQVGVNFY